MQYFEVTFKGLISLQDGDPSPENWSWAPEYLDQRIKDMTLGMDVHIQELGTHDPDIDGSMWTMAHLDACQWDLAGKPICQCPVGKDSCQG